MSLRRSALSAIQRDMCLNGFPVRLVVPGWFATYWVKALSQITVRTEPLHNFWVDTAYRVPTTPGYNEDPKHPSEQTTPITRHLTRFFVLSFVALGILPARQLQAEIDRTAPRSMQPLTASEAHGRVVYGREGCAYCQPSISFAERKAGLPRTEGNGI
jgi:Oxidoreductase molybdopterin binding domain